MNEQQRTHYDKFCSIAGSKSGLIISDKYIDSRKYVKAKCRGGHEFEITPDKIKAGRWCRK